MSGSADSDSLDSLLNRFAAAWRQVTGASPTVDLARYLPSPTDPLRAEALRELIAVDLEFRWRRRRGVLLDYYQRLFPELGRGPALPAMLVFEEYRVRFKHGDRPSRTHYRERFPEQYPQVLDMILRDKSLDGPPPELSANPGSPVPAAHVADGSQVLSVGGGYRLLQRLGAGAFGEVWKAQTLDGIEVAVKIITQPRDAEKAKKELKALENVKCLRHPFLVQTHAYFFWDERLHIVMELVDGSLSDRVRQCRKQGLTGIPQDELLGYFAEAAEALDYLHTKSVQHRDIKPENILLLGGHVKVADFGLARLLQPNISVMDATFCGTPMYMAPEVWLNMVSQHSDQWSLAATYVELRLGRRLCRGSNIFELMAEIREGKYDLEPLAEAERQVLCKALANDSHERYGSCKEFVHALGVALRPPPPEPVPETVIPPVPVAEPATEVELVKVPQLKARLTRWVAAALVACLVPAGGSLGLALYLYWTPTPPPTRIVFDKLEPLEVATGREATFRLRVTRQNFDRPIALTCMDGNAQVTIPPQVIAAGEQEVRGRVLVDQKATPGTYRFHIQTDAVSPPPEVVLELTVLFLPRDFEPAGEVVPDGNGIHFYKRIARTVGGMSVPFVLIPRKSEEERQRRKLDLDPPTFYMMQDKVSVGLFRKFLALGPDKAAVNKWQGGADNRYPALGMTVDEAERCAQWLGGHLPKLEQWDKGAGRYEVDRGAGPFQGNWENNPKPRVAVNRTDRGPAPVGLSQDDVSRFGCRDMAGNGQEWTRTLRLGRGFVPIANPGREHWVLLRGQRFVAECPLYFADLEKERNPLCLPYKNTSPDLGFRVVIEQR